MNRKITNNILVLDDDQFMLQLIAHMLENQGCTSVTGSDNGREALEMVDSPRGRPELIFLDLNLPGMDGMEFVRHLVERNYSGSLVLMSGEDDQLLRSSTKLVRSHNIPVVGSLHKPITAEMLTSVIDSAFPPRQADIAASGNGKRIADELRVAIDEGQLINYYQPMVSLANGDIVGVEVLVRWLKPQGESVSPYKFLGVAEAFGLIQDLARLVLHNAMLQIKAWQDAGLPLQLSVNVSEYNIEALDFADTVTALAAEAGIAPQHVTLEVAEGWLPMNDLRAPLETLTRLHLNRFRLALDEFGTGYSTLAQLRDLPFDEIKIDRNFVCQVATDAKIRAKYQSDLAMARQLQMAVVAVGVENIEDWRVLRSTGCDFAQGGFIAEAMPAEELPGWMRNWKLRVETERQLFADQDSGSFIH